MVKSLQRKLWVSLKALLEAFLSTLKCVKLEKLACTLMPQTIFPATCMSLVTCTF